MRLITLTIFIVLAAGCACMKGVPSEEQAEFLEHVDKILGSAYEEGSEAKYAEAKSLLLERCGESCSNPAVLWRLASCCHYITILNKNLSPADKRALLKEGYKYAESALFINDQVPEAHKWMAILSGQKGNFDGSTAAKVRGGILFQKHLNRALELKPNDPTLHVLKGCFQFEVGKMNRFQRAAVSNIFSGIPCGTMKNAIETFHRVDELCPQRRKLNSAYLARCYCENRNPAEALRWLKIAEEIDVESHEDIEAQELIDDLRKSLPGNCKKH